jgi:L-fucose mutarotase/ribose pyranase (RbsD/FucU family)
MSVPDIARKATDWEEELVSTLPVYGHRNWIVIADAAYPAQSAPGITTIVADADQGAVIEKALSLISQSRHVKANVYVDLELDLVDEGYAPGITAHRSQISRIFVELEITRLLHEKIIEKLDVAARMFSVLIVKTRIMLPYTSVFLELDCSYWTAAAEIRLRSAVEDQASRSGWHDYNGPYKAGK